MINSKKSAAERAVSYVSNGMTVGLGTGTTAYWVILQIADKIKSENLKIRAIATSVQSEKLAVKSGIKLIPFDKIGEIDLTIDGADEVDENKDLIKGGGGALLREKIVAYNSRQLIIVVDQSKLVHNLGKFPLPVEIAVFGWEKTMDNLAGLGCQPSLRIRDDVPFLTDNGHYIIDCNFQQISNPSILNREIKSVPGVMETGLFIEMADKIVVGYEDGKVDVLD
jgi:ribose 5-phosphate isomerase A